MNRFILSLSILALVSCSSPASSEKEVAAQEITIELDNGKKWKVPEDMMTQVEKIQNELNAFSGETIEDFNAFGDHQRHEINTLIKICTMEGKGHEELHKWLVPIISYTDTLKISQDLHEAEQLVKHMKDANQMVHTYFE